MEKKKISFFGDLGSYSHEVCSILYKDKDYIPCNSFDKAISSVTNGEADLAVLPVENSSAGRVADIHVLLPKANLFIIKEYYYKVNHHLLANKGAKISDITDVYSYVQALTQCSSFIDALQLNKQFHNDTAGAAKYVAERKKGNEAAIASSLAGKIHGLESIRSNIQNTDTNTTRFIVMSRQDERPALGESVMTSILFTVRNIPGALYKSLGGFATNNVNVTKLESYLVDSKFTAARFYIEVEGHPKEDKVWNAVEELKFFTSEMKILGVYQRHPYRDGIKSNN